MNSTQHLLGVPISTDFLDFMNRSLVELRVENRSQFVRDAIREKLVRMGHEPDLSHTVVKPRYLRGRTKRPR